MFSAILVSLCLQCPKGVSFSLCDVSQSAFKIQLISLTKRLRRSATETNCCFSCALEVGCRYPWCIQFNTSSKFVMQIRFVPFE